MSKTFQKVFLIFLLSTFIISCDKTNEEEIIVPKAKSKLVEFGFNIHDFNLVNDTIKSGDTFGSLLEKQNLYGTISNLIVRTGFDLRPLPAYVNFYGTNFNNKVKTTPSKRNEI